MADGAHGGDALNVERARQLRKNLTDTERFVWARLRSRRFTGYKFRRQMPIGPYIVDFICLERRLVLELDGGQHVKQMDYDAKRTRWLESQGFEVLRFWDHEALQDRETVAEVIWRRLEARADADVGPGGRVQ
jgi:very-short-patch-repair endonuclease